MQTDCPPVENILVYMCRYVHAWTYTCILLVSANNKRKKNVYCIYPRYSDISTSYHACSKIRTSTIYYPMLCLKVAGWAVWTLLGRGVPPGSAQFAQACLSECIRWVRF